MLRYINITCIILSSIALFCCKKSAETSFPYEERLSVQSITLHRKKELRYFQFYHENKKVSKIEISTSRGSYKRSMKYHYKEDGRLKSITHHPIGNPIKFRYKNNRLKDISYYDNSQTREFFYDKEERIVKETIHFNNKLFLVIKYTYTNKHISKITHEDPSGNTLRQYQVTFSPLVNIFKDLGPDLNLTENIFGYTIGNYPLLIQEITEIRSSETSIFNIKDFLFTYNRYNYPLTINNEWEITYQPVFSR